MSGEMETLLEDARHQLSRWPMARRRLGRRRRVGRLCSLWIESDQSREQFLKVGCGTILHEQHVPAFEIGLVFRTANVYQIGDRP
jgi:hypothetical protein